MTKYNKSRKYKSKKKDSKYATCKWVERNYSQTGVHNFNWSLSAVDPSTLYVHSLNQIAKGTDVGQRIGDVINLKGILGHWTFRNQNIAKRIFLRILVVADKKPAQPMGEDFFATEQNTANPKNFDGNGQVSQINKPMNKQRYTVYFDKVYEAGPDSSGDGFRNTNLIKFYIPFKNKKIKYNTSSDTAVNTTPNLKMYYWIASHDSETIFPVGQEVELGVNIKEYYEM